MIITLTGSNSFLLLQRLRQLSEQFIAENSDLAIERIEASAVEAQHIIDAVSSLPFLSTKKMVVLRELGLNKPVAEQIEQIIDSTESTTELIIYEPSPDRRTAYYKTLASRTNLEEFKELDKRQLTSWLLLQSHKLNAKLSLSDADYLVDRVGLNQAILQQELEKLSLYNPQISRQNIDLLTEKTPQSKVFDLLDAAFAGHGKKALNLYEDQRAQKVEPQAILALIIWQLHLIALAKYGAGKTSTQIAQEAGVGPYPMQKAQNLAKSLSESRLREITNEAADIDYYSKVSAVDIDEALKNLLVGI